MYSGMAVHSETLSVLRSANDFGASSPTTMCRYDNVMKATRNEIVETVCGLSMPRLVNKRLEQIGECGFTDPAEAERRERNSELARREIRVEVAVNARQHRAAPA